MGMGTAPSSSYCISEDDLRSICPLECDAVDSLLDEYEVTWDDLAHCVVYYNSFYVWEDYPNEKLTVKQWDIVITAWENLVKAFALATSVDDSVLDLYIGLYSSDDVSVADGIYFHLGGVEALTPAGEKIKDKIVFPDNSWTKNRPPMSTAI